MKLNQPIEIDLKVFFLSGKFDCLKLGQTKDWIINNFPDPDVADDGNGGYDIWTYGSLELHFHRNQLYLIWCDGLDAIDACRQLCYQKWFMENNWHIKFLDVLDILNKECVDYKVKHENLYSVRVKIAKSNVVLHFEGDEFENSNGYTLIAFGLSSEGYDNI